MVALMLAACLPLADDEPATTAAPPAVVIDADVEYARRGERRLLLDVFRPAEPSGTAPAVLVIHGGAWRVGSKEQLRGYAYALARRGMVAFAIDYRLAPRSRFPAQIDDVRDAIRFVRANAGRYRVDAARVGAIGYSAGAHLAFLAAVAGAKSADADATLQAVACGGTPADFRQIPADLRMFGYFFGGSRAEVPQAYEAASPMAFVTADCPPAFFWHGSADRLVPLDGVRAAVALLRAEGVPTELLVVQGKGHTAAATDRAAVDRAFDFLSEHLQHDRPAAGPTAGAAGKD